MSIDFQSPAIGLALPNNWGLSNAHDLVTLAQSAEELGFASVWVHDHLLNTAYVAQRIGVHGSYYDPLATISWIGALTSTIRLGTSVLVLPYHNPLRVAKVCATIQRLSRGRFTLGVGTGWLRSEFDQLSIPYDDRAMLTNDSLDILRQLWSGRPVTYSGRHWNFTCARVTPVPRQTIPVWIGGNSEAARNRAVKRGDGWHPIARDDLTPEQYGLYRASMTSMMTSCRGEQGRFAWSIRLEIPVPSFPNNLSRLGSQVADTIGAYIAVGCDEVVVAPLSDDTSQILRLLRRLSARLRLVM